MHQSCEMKWSNIDDGVQILLLFCICEWNYVIFFYLKCKLCERKWRNKHIWLGNGLRKR